MRRLLALALWLCLGVSPALAAFTFTFQDVGFNDTGSVHSASSGNVTASAGTLEIVTGDIVGLNASSDSVFVTDGAGNPYTVYQCPQTAGSVNVGFVAWSNLATALAAQPVTVSDTSNGGTNISAGGAIGFLTWTLAGAAVNSPEDVAVRACAGSTSASTSPTVTSGTPVLSGEFFLSNYITPSNSSGFTYTVDSGHGWAGGSVNGATRQASVQDSQTNAGSGTKINNPTTTSRAYAIQTLGFFPVVNTIYGGGTTVGVGH